MSDIMVSVSCLVYNHETYLRKCLDGFVNQKTNFKFEVLVHDDASTDGSVDIIREYEKKYPEIIKPIYQTENQYSKHIGILKTYQYPRAQGKYIAYCEGDDYWIDDNKLQRQFDFLEANPNYTACSHRTQVNHINSGTMSYIPNISKAREYSAEEIIKSGVIFSVNSFVIKKEKILNMPECFQARGFGDYQLFMYSAISGGLYVFPDVMSVYNHGTDGSWTIRVANSVEKCIEHDKVLISMLERVDAYYNGKYHDAFQYAIDRAQYHIYFMQKDQKNYKKRKYREFDKKRRKNRVKAIIKSVLVKMKLIK